MTAIEWTARQIGVMPPAPPRPKEPVLPATARRTLAVLRHEGRATMAELMHETGYASQTLANALTVLVRNGWATRRPNYLLGHNQMDYLAR